MTIDLSHVKAAVQRGQSVHAFTAGKLVSAVEETMKLRSMTDAYEYGDGVRHERELDAITEQADVVRTALRWFH